LRSTAASTSSVSGVGMVGSGGYESGHAVSSGREVDILSTKPRASCGGGIKQAGSGPPPNSSPSKVVEIMPPPRCLGVRYFPMVTTRCASALYSELLCVSVSVLFRIMRLQLVVIS
jgi:hypothetical protein